MKTTVNDMVERFKRLTQDDTLTRWSQAEIIDWLNEAYLRVVDLRPDATATRASVSLATGPYQSLDDTNSVNLPDAMSIIRVVRNAGVVKNAIRFIAEDELNYNLPDWTGDIPVNKIERWGMSVDSPREFFVYPPARKGTLVELLYAANPGAHDPTDQDALQERIKLADSYAPVLLDYIAYRAYQKDADDPVNAGKATAYVSSFMAGLGSKNAADVEKG